MTLPKWNSDWEKPDSLRGSRGWGRHHYAAVIVSVFLAGTAICLFVPAAAKARQKRHELDETYEMVRRAMNLAASGSP